MREDNRKYVLFIVLNVLYVLFVVLTVYILIPK